MNKIGNRKQKGSKINKTRENEKECCCYLTDNIMIIINGLIIL